jgi:penicillin-binding protein-related factor A (putative recombinase)
LCFCLSIYFAATKSKQQEARSVYDASIPHAKWFATRLYTCQSQRGTFCSTFIIARAHQKEQLFISESFRLCKFANKATSGRKSILEQHLNALMERSESVKVGKTLRADFLRGKISRVQVT